VTRRQVVPALAVAGLLAYFVFRVGDFGPFALLAVLLLGASLALLYDPALATARGHILNASPRQVGLVALSCAVGFILLGDLDRLIRPPHPWRTDPQANLADQIGWAVFVLACAPLPAPMLANLLRRPAEGRPLWPILAGLVGGGIAMLGVEVLWQALLSPLITERRALHVVALLSPSVLSEAGLALGLGGSVWWRALRNGRAARFDGAGVFAVALQTAITFLLLGVASCLAVAFGLIGGSTTSFGVRSSAALLVLIGLAWSGCLWRLTLRQPAGALQAVAVILLIALTLPFGLALAASLAQPGSWPEFSVLVVAPLTCLAAAVVFWGGPWGLGWLLTAGRHPSGAKPSNPGV
jgi:hypothetical protein